ncbi:MAG TPA: Gfo/Idh/MocA family oxidoreductase [Phycisphaerales bacterium]|nr:Gfo/Idh/MocA family oxidoreductase [Phycisphaerales bacterium]
MISRRRFVALSSAVAVAPLFLNARVLGRSRPGPSNALGLGFIGVGIQGRSLLNTLKKRDAVRILAVCDVDSDRRLDAKKRVDTAYENSDCAAFGHHADLLAHPGIDAVVIASPDHWHAHHVLDAAAAGKDIYCEKPLSLNLHEARVMIEGVRKHGRVFQTGSQQRSEYAGRFRTACEYVRSGRLGAVSTIHVGIGDTARPCDLGAENAPEGLDWDRWLGPAPLRPYNSILSPRGVHDHYPRWRDYREYSGGMITDWGAHHFDIVQWALGADGSGPVRALPPREPGSLRGARLIYPGGVEAVHDGPFGITFIGEKGVIYVDRDRVESIPGDILRKPLGDKDIHLAKATGHMQNWLDCIRTREPCICDVEIGARSVACCHLMNLAYWHGRPLTWDPTKWEFPGDDEANGWRDYQRRAGYELPTI